MCEMVSLVDEVAELSLVKVSVNDLRSIRGAKENGSRACLKTGKLSQDSDGLGPKSKGGILILLPTILVY